MDTPTQGWIKLFYQFRSWEWYGDPNMVSLFIHLLLRANFRPVRQKGVLYDRGVVVTSREELSRETGISEQTVRTCLTRLKSTNEITIKSTKQGSVITICNYDRYQYTPPDINQAVNQPTNHELTNDQPTTDQQLTNSKEYKNIITKYLVVD
ncbi:MAG: hypothetical protein K2J06_05375, partial [Muribaculaceae bacterium]|nr:hypothetical protein [Muribaculaceae bacterium]